MGTSLSSAAKTARIVSLQNFHLLLHSCVKMNNSQFLLFHFQVGNVVSCTHKFRPLYNCIVLVSIKISKRSIFNVFETKSKRKVNFGSVFESFEYQIQFPINQKDVWGLYGEIDNTISRFFKFRVNEKLLTCLEFFFEVCVVIFKQVIHVKFSWFYLNSMLLVCFGLSQRIKPRKLFGTNFTLVCNFHSRFCMFLSKMIN